MYYVILNWYDIVAILDLFKLHSLYTLTMLGCLNPNLGKIWTNPNVGLKM